MIVQEHYLDFPVGRKEEHYIRESSSGRGFIYGEGKAYGATPTSKFIFNGTSMIYGDGAGNGAGYDNSTGEGELII